MALPRKLLTTGEVMTLLNVSRPTLRRLIEAGEVPATKVGPQFRIDADDLEAYLAAGRVRVATS